MNLNYGSDHYIVRYLQAFLQENYSSTIAVSGIYDENTHSALIGYLNLPNTETIDYVQRQVIDNYPELLVKFVVTRGLDSIIFTSKSTNQDTKDYMEGIESSLSLFVNNFGWEITEFTNYNNSDVTKFKIVITSSGRENKFPNSEMMCMMNQFDNNYYYNLSIRDGVGIDDMIHSSDSFKIAIIPCSPNQTFTIAHGYSRPTPIVIGSSQFYVDDIIKGNLPVDNVLQLDLASGASVAYTTTANCKNLIIQMPYNGLLNEETTTVKVPVKLGDVNLNNIIDQTDRDLLSEFIKTGQEFKGAQFVAADINQDGVVNNDDLALLDRFLNKEISSLGVAYYNEIIEHSSSNLSKLLVVSGDYAQDTEINIPFSSYATDPWMVHDKFLNYLLDRAITKYSDVDTIYYLQKLVSALYREYSPESVGTYDFALRNIIRDYQKRHKLAFTTGYLDVETEAMMLKELDGSGVNLYE